MSSSLSSGLSYRSISGLQNWRIHYNISLGDFATKNNRLGLVLLRTYTIGVLVLVNNVGSKRRRRVCVS